MLEWTQRNRITTGSRKRNAFNSQTISFIYTNNCIQQGKNFMNYLDTTVKRKKNLTAIQRTKAVAVIKRV